MSEEVIYREATAGDYEGVLDIDRDGFRGLDYLPALYESYMQDPRRHCYVAVKGSEVIGFCMVHIVDGGGCMIGQGARVSPQYRSQGIWQVLRQLPLAKNKPRYPNANHFIVLSKNKPIVLRQRKQKIFMFDLIMERSITEFQLEYMDQAKWTNQCMINKINHLFPSDKQIKNLSKIDLTTILDSKENQWRLFKNGKIMLAREVLEPMSENWDIITEELCRTAPCFSTYNPSEPQPFVESLSFGEALPVASGLMYRIEYYGTVVEDLLAHICQHLEKIWIQYRQGSLHVLLYTPAEINHDQIQEYIRDYLGLCIKNLSKVYAFKLDIKSVDISSSFTKPKL